VIVEVLELLLATAGIGALFSWPSLERRRTQRRHKAFLRTLDPSVEIALGVAMHEATTRRQPVSTVHLLYGLLQDETFTAAIAKLGVDAETIEASVHGVLDRAVPESIDPRDANLSLARASLVAQHHARRATLADLWRFLIETEAAKLVEDATVSPVALLFVLVHGMVEPAPVIDSPYVHVVLRNDDYTTFDLVHEILREVFELPAAEAVAMMQAAHTSGRAIIGRFSTSVAKSKLEAARARARATGSPLWVGVEAC
jgi:ATP-dependent Clp protease adapter protein ClpS